MKELAYVERDFGEIKKQYNQMREQELIKLSNYFKKDKEFKGRHINRGRTIYKSGGRLRQSYDLSVWKWFCISRNEVQFFISLQAFERDRNSGNLHILMDRLGIYAYVGEYSPVDAQTKMLVTDIELPLDDEKLRNLRGILRKLSECQCFTNQIEYINICKEANLYI